MLHTFLHPPFADPVKQAQFESLQSVLAAESEVSVSLLLGNFAVEEDGEIFDAVVVRSHSVSMILFVTNGGQLTIPIQGAAPWQLDGQPIQVSGTAGNPFAQFRRLKQELAGWLDAQLGVGQVPAELLTGFALFAEPVTFGAGVEQYLRTQSGADSFELLGDINQLPRRLRQAAHPEIQLSDTELAAWAQDLANEHPEEASTNDHNPTGDTDEPNGYWTQKARQLWHWLGAEDVPHDAPYGSAASVAANSEEKRQLEQMRQQIKDELAQQRQQMEAREAEREKSIALLRAQLAQAPTAAPDATALQARLATETREKEALEAAIRTSRNEAASRNQELDARIQQLGQLIEQFQAKPPAPAASTTNTTVKRPATKPAPHNLVKRPTTQLRWPRVAVVVGAAAGIGLGVWGLARVVKDKEQTHLNRTQVSNNEPERTTTGPSLDALTDTITREIAAVSDSATITQAPEATPLTTSEINNSDASATHDTLYTEPAGPVEPEIADSTGTENP
ncbi:hypothetical protein [Hymenobacter norwichensis]|uniref:hypothetical protein n=1 Tax=Hymenobacter norwichensis TaxID=223903 RepID=UPI0003B63462|nr:hypothetical protein [Hymenobacter norwichensis]